MGVDLIYKNMHIFKLNYFQFKQTNMADVTHIAKCRSKKKILQYMEDLKKQTRDTLVQNMDRQITEEEIKMANKHVKILQSASKT